MKTGPDLKSSAEWGCCANVTFSTLAVVVVVAAAVVVCKSRAGDYTHTVNLSPTVFIDTYVVFQEMNCAISALDQQ